MKIVELYKYENDDGSISISPENRPGGINIEYKYRLIADEGKVITDGENTFYRMLVNFLKQKNQKKIIRYFQKIQFKKPRLLIILLEKKINLEEIKWIQEKKF